MELSPSKVNEHINLQQDLSFLEFHQLPLQKKQHTMGQAFQGTQPLSIEVACSHFQPRVKKKKAPDVYISIKVLSYFLKDGKLCANY